MGVGQILKHVGDVCYILCNAQNHIERLLETPKKMAQLIKTKQREPVVIV